MLQGEFAGHGAQVPADLIAADKAHPANGGLGDAWDVQQEEMYLIKHHDRSLLRAIWYLRHHPNKVEEKGYFPVSWVRNAGKGRVFYSSLGHREDIWSDDPTLPNRVNPPETSKKYQAHILGGIKWALGLEKGSADPNPWVK
jgi:type 1 glutamine amidotransferase